MGRDLIDIWHRETTRRERLRYGLGAGCLFSGGIIVVLALLILFNPDAPAQRSLSDALEIGISLVCCATPFFFMVATGTYVQLTYAGMWRRLAKRLQDQAKKEDADNTPGPPTCAAPVC
ncbi:MAG: hypothetical protein IT317_03540 [Anaerolineales bacterium]|nr:hypothetical protein [Anaerolineales bacterium]